MAFAAILVSLLLCDVSFRPFSHDVAKARYLKAQDTLRILSEGLESYRASHKQFPEFQNFSAMVDSHSSLVTENLIPVNIQAIDPWGQQYTGSSSKSHYELRCAGDPTNQNKYPPFTLGGNKP